MAYWDVKPYQDISDKLSSQGFTKILQDYMDIYSGRKSPTELPMYKTFYNDLETMFAKSAPDIMKEATARGIRGGSLGNILTSGHNDLIDKSVRAIYDMYKQAPNVVGGAYGTGVELGQQELNRMVKQFEAYKGRHLAAEEAKMQGITSGVTSGISGCGSAAGGMAKCMIFITADCLTCNVKKFRDENYTADSYVAIGYGKMAKWLVPLMLKHKTIKELIRFLLSPLVKFADAYEKNDKLRMNLYAPFGLFWTILWDMYGRISKRSF